MKTYQIDEELRREIALILKDYIEKIELKHPKEAIRICKAGNKLMNLSPIEKKVKMKTYKISEDLLNRVRVMLVDYQKDVSDLDSMGGIPENEVAAIEALKNELERLDESL